MRETFTKSCRNLFIGTTYLFLYVPLIVLFVYSFNVESFPSPWKAFSLKWYVALFDDLLLWEAFHNSLLIACVATLLSVLMGTLLVFSASQGGKIGRYLNLYYGNLIVPETVLAIALLGFFAFIAVPFGLPTLIIAHTILGIGYRRPDHLRKVPRDRPAPLGGLPRPRCDPHPNLFPRHPAASQSPP